MKNCFLRKYDENPSQTVRDLKSIAMEILSVNKGMFEYCTALKAQIQYIGRDAGGR